MKPILRLDKVSKRFGGVIAANDVSFSVYPGRINGLIGPNGAGKSTLMNLISGIYEVDSGEIFLDEVNITDIPAHKRARMGLGRTFQTPRFLQRSNIRDNLLLGTDLGGKYNYFQSYFGKKNPNFEENLEKLMSYVRFSFDLKSDISSLTYGQQKMLEIIRTMLSEPKVMLVDEPVAGLTSSEMDDVMDLLEYASTECKIGVVLIEHSMDMVMNLCKDIVVISFGKVICSGTPQCVSCDPAVIEAYLGGEINA